MSYYERRLPHWLPEGRALFITWRLWGSLPSAVEAKALGRLERRMSALRTARGQECPRHPEPFAGRRFWAADRELDTARFGPRWLSDAAVARIVMDCLRRGENDLGHYRLHAFVIMPNHVHILIEPGVHVPKALKAIKGTTARAANRILGRTGRRFWQEESFDHWVRNESEFERICAYIEGNPVAAGLVRNPEDWPWSSGALRSRT
jgi:REP-associated tyrosine transposase